jgi:hypothetical protein
VADAVRIEDQGAIEKMNAVKPLINGLKYRNDIICVIPEALIGNPVLNTLHSRLRTRKRWVQDRIPDRNVRG